MRTISEGKIQVPCSTLLAKVGGNSSAFFFQANRMEVMPITRKNKSNGIPSHLWIFRRIRRRLTLELEGDSSMTATSSIGKTYSTWKGEQDTEK
jgi:hypothetical protein